MAEHQEICGGENPNLVEVAEIFEVIDDGDFVEIIDIEIYAKQGKKPPRAKKYKFRIDRESFIVENRIITGAELFKLAGKSPAEYRMHQKMHGGHMREIGIGDKVDLGEQGVERFATMKLTEGDGETTTVAQSEPAAALRRQFHLPADDVGYLDSLGLRWETIKNPQGRWVLIHDQRQGHAG